MKYKIDAASILDGIDAGGNYYNQLREAAYTLIDQKLEQKKHKNHFKVYTLFSTIEYENGIIKGEFHSDLLPFFLKKSLAISHHGLELQKSKFQYQTCTKC